ncbi:HIT family protein [Candidatus Chloroploca asiatica]|uniref:HIT family hydrolase n=1 Tax=Candidatus Chloroploca asiatica TaxID=1506545 RepID=A0A2H3KP29_9CHLR|nr:HIT domain-containing protein [Candidatus Chloroploca asiatica]PDV96896.1 HIT family hydrolase [Candidatus Chloroploca asiatica]
METKFTPWRMNYIKRDPALSEDDCVFCAIADAPPDHDPEHLILYRGRQCFIVLNLYPYNTAHTMVIPYLHTADLAGLDAATAQELFDLTRWCVTILQAEYQPHGFNLGMNLGRIAGAGIAEHLHMHIVPRWNGDTNFMPIVGTTKLIPEELNATYARLRPHFTDKGVSATF